MLRLREATPQTWLDAVLGDLDAFLQDHAHNERKVVGAALQLAAQAPTDDAIVSAMVELAEEELSHFRRLVELLHRRGLTLGYDLPDPYMGRLHKLLRKGHTPDYLLDRLLVFGIVEARGCERFQLLGEALPEAEAELKALYRELFRSEARHHQLFTGLATDRFGREACVRRLDELLEAEAGILRGLTPRAALH